MDFQRARRSCLSVPGSSEKMLRKAPTVGADELVLDLEDAVAPDFKAQARELVLDLLSGGAFGGGLVAVRVNAPRTPWCHEDLIGLAGAAVAPGSIVVPKVESPYDLAF